MKLLIVSKEAEVCLELLIRIISRFYPRIMFSSTHNDAVKYILRYKKLSKSINSNIEVGNESDQPTFIIKAAKESNFSSKIPFIHIGSDNWIARISHNRHLGFAKTDNPFGAAMSACIAAANLFKYVFQEQLKVELDKEINFSTLEFSSNGEYPDNYKLKEVKLQDLTIVGIGAIGSATVWALSKIKKLSGNITVIDHDKVEEPNLQRYILLHEKDKNKWKVDIAKKTLRRGHLKIYPKKCKWEKYIFDDHNGICKASLVAVAVDSKEDRIKVQSSLPKKILNAYTDGSRFGISRHLNFNNNVCLACLYIPNHEQKSHLEKIAEELNMKSDQEFLYKYMASSKPIDDNFLDIFCSRNNIENDNVKIYKGKQFGDFYLEMACGYGILKFKNENEISQQIDVPLSFQSCMAGIMLAVEIVVESIGIKRTSSDETQWQVLKPITADNPDHLNYIKNFTGNCICSDSDYNEVYKEKWKEVH